MSRENMEEFINVYESEPCLWKTKCREYHDKNQRDAAYARLVENMKVIEPTATKDMAAKKINNIRSAYRKEKKKIGESMKTGSGSEDVYEPKLWYFKLLRFLDDPDTPRASRSNIDGHKDNENEDEPSDLASQDSANNEPSEPPTNSVQETSEVTDSCEPIPRKRKSQTRKTLLAGNDILAKEVMLTVNEHFKKPRLAEDRFDIFGKSVAIKLRSLPKQQMLFAEKLINDVMFYADMEKLDFSTVLSTTIVNNMFYGNRASPTPSPPYSSSSIPSSHSTSPQHQTQLVLQAQQFEQVQYHPQSPALDSQNERPTSAFFTHYLP